MQSYYNSNSNYISNQSYNNDQLAYLRAKGIYTTSKHDWAREQP